MNNFSLSLSLICVSRKSADCGLTKRKNQKAKKATIKMHFSSIDGDDDDDEEVYKYKKKKKGEKKINRETAK